MKELVGAAVAVVAALLYDAGYVLEKQALNELPPVRLTPAGVLRVAASSRRWLAGFTAMLAGLALQVVALTLAPVSVVQPILAGGLIALAAAGSSLLGERLTRRQVAALVLVVLAIALVAASARSSNLATAVPGARFVVLLVVVAALAVAAIRAGLAPRAQASWPSRAAGLPLTLSGLAGIALGAGLLYGLGAVAEKAVATQMVRHGLVAGGWSALTTAYPWVFVGATFVGMLVFQVGLQRNPASLMAALTNVTSTVCALVGASVIFQEAVLPSSWWAAVRAGAFACVLGAVALVAVDGASVPPIERARPETAQA